MSNNKENLKHSLKIVGAGLVALDIIINNSDKNPIFSAGGTCGNVLAGLSFLGWKSTPISRVGKDIASQILIQDLLDNGVNVDHITHEERVSTPRIIEKLNSNGVYAKHSFLLRCPICNTYLPRFRSPKLKIIDGIISKKHLNPDVYLFDRVTPSTLKLANKYRESGTLIFFEPINIKNTDDFKEAFRLSHIVKYADIEKKKRPKELAKDQILKKIKSFGPMLVIKTLGKYGLSFLNSNKNKTQYRESFKINRIYDSCGAGDWCTVGLLFYLHELAKNNNISILETMESNALINSALRFGQILASLSCMFIGARGLSNSIDAKKILKIVHTQMIKNNEIDVSMSKYPPRNSKKTTIANEINTNPNTCPTCLLN